VTRACAVCGSPTQSHEIHDSAVCHGCFTDEADQVLAEAVGATLRYDLTAETRLECGGCGNVYTVRAASSVGHGFYTGRAGLPGVEASASVTCPACREVEMVYTSDAALADIHREIADEGGRT